MVEGDWVDKSLHGRADRSDGEDSFDEEKTGFLDELSARYNPHGMDDATVRSEGSRS